MDAQKEAFTMLLIKKIASLEPATKDHNPSIGAGTLNTLIEDAQAILEWGK